MQWLDYGLFLLLRTCHCCCKSGFFIYQIYDTSDFVVGLSTQVFIFLFVPINFPSVWIIDNWGLRVSVTIFHFKILSGIVLTTAGMWIRLVVVLQPYFYWVLIG